RKPGETSMTLKLTIAASLAALTMLATTSAFAAIGELNSDANVRAGAGTEYDIIAYADEGTNVDCVDFEDGWCELADDEGFIAGSLIDFDGGYDGDDDDHDHDHDYYSDVDIEIGYKYGGFEFEIEY